MPLCFVARCKLAEPALHLLFAKHARGGRLSSPKPASLGGTPALLAPYTGIAIIVRKLYDAFEAEEVNRHSNTHLARGHVNALKAIQDNCGMVTYNLGTGKGEKAERELGWRAEYGINEMVRDSWNWQKRNPNGFE